MEGVSATVYKGLKSYWKRRGYERVNGSGQRRMKTVELGSPRKRRRIFRFKVKPKLKIFRMPSPKKFFIWLRDAYVNMMMGFANSRVLTAAYSGGAAGDGVSGFVRGPVKEYDEKMIYEIYKSILIAQGQLVPRDAAKLASGIVCRG